MMSMDVGVKQYALRINGNFSKNAFLYKKFQCVVNGGFGYVGGGCVPIYSLENGVCRQVLFSFEHMCGNGHALAGRFDAVRVKKFTDGTVPRGLLWF